MSNHTPKIIALCGHPQHGKSTVQGMLEKLGVTSLDDGRPIRLEGMKRFGLTWEQVSTQEGKLEKCSAFGRTMEVREALGLIGKEHEEGNIDHWAEEAVRLVREDMVTTPVSFGSVRRQGGHVYRAAGGIVLEIRDPRKPDSVYDFDKYDMSAVTRTIVNDGTLEDLRAKVIAAVSEYLEFPNV